MMKINALLLKYSFTCFIKKTTTNGKRPLTFISATNTQKMVYAI